jgi:GMP synthase (glutamine-hydrolysing)
VKPFLFLGIRAEDAVADEEYAAVLRCSGLPAASFHRLRVERSPLPALTLDDWSGIVLGGGPWNISDALAAKSPAQVAGEAWLRSLALQVVDADFPFLGACYGIGTLGTLAGGVVDRSFPEPIGSATISLTQEGADDPLLGVLPPVFDAFLGHKEAVATLPGGAVRLASSAACPVQAFRIGRHVHATQFHPELDVPALVNRILAYRDYGYYGPGEGEALVAAARAAVVTEPPRILERFVELYARD